MNKLREYEQALILEEKSPQTIGKYVRDVRRFLLWSDTRPLTKELALYYKAALTESYSTASVNSTLSALNSYFKFLGRPDCCLKVIKRQRAIFANTEQELSKAEYLRLLRAAQGDPRLWLLMQTICSTGIRVSEHRFITLEAARRGFAEVNLKGKQRRVYLPRKLCLALSDYAVKAGIRSGSIFVTAGGQPLNRSNIWAQMKKLCRAADVAESKVYPHNLRHLFARTYYSMEKDIVRLADILGHASVNTTRIYTRESGYVHQQQIEKMQLLYTT